MSRLLTVVLLLVLVIFGGVVVYSFWIKRNPTVQPQVQYQNPLDKKTQYTNPFSSYKNPFDGLR